MKLAIYCLLILLLVNLPNVYYSWYMKLQWFDIAQHFLGGFFVAMLFSHYMRGHFLPNKKINNALIIIGATIFMGVVWEFTEYIANQTLVVPTQKYFGINAYFMGDLEDTIMDLLIDILGASSFYILHLFRSRNSHQAKTVTENIRDSAT